MTDHRVVSRDEWLAARKALLAEEKAFTRERDALAAKRRALPWVRVEKAYRFRAPEGEVGLAELFGDCSQLIVYHFMLGPDWEAGCKSCSFWMDSFNGTTIHLKHRDASLVLISHAPLAKIEAFRQRMGWEFRWVSSADSDFNYDYHVSFTADEEAKDRVDYNYETRSFMSSEMPGLSVFYKDRDGTIYHTYSCYARGLDALNSAYQLLDLAPKGRDEAELPYTMSWVRLHDEYGA